eukprot:5333797-Amphidinium_carterae.1
MPRADPVKVAAADRLRQISIGCPCDKGLRAGLASSHQIQVGRAQGQSRHHLRNCPKKYF